MPWSIFVAHPSSLLTDHRPHGDGLIAFGYIRELAARGHELHVAAERVDVRDQLPPNVHLYRLGAEPPHLLKRPTYMWRMRRLFLRLRARTTFDLVHQLNPVDVGLTLALADIPLPVVLGPYWPDWPDYEDRAGSLARPVLVGLKRALRAAQQRRATTVLLSTPAAATKLEIARRSHPYVRELSPGIDDRAWTPAGARRPGQEVLFLANLRAHKGIFVLLEAFAMVAAELPEARLLVGGAGREADEVRRRVLAFPSPHRVELLGDVERDRVQSVMRACAVYCLPSDGEPFGMTALEAMACAKPVVATDAGGLRHVLDDEGGRRVAPGDAHALAAALREVLVDPRLQRAMGEHNRRVVEERFSWSRVVERLEGLYREAIEKSNASSRAAAGRPGP
jgi:L-malate glycosyltransferase